MPEPIGYSAVNISTKVLAVADDTIRNDYILPLLSECWHSVIRSYDPRLHIFEWRPVVQQSNSIIVYCDIYLNERVWNLKAFL